MVQSLEDRCRQLRDDFGEYKAHNTRADSAPDMSIVIPAFREAPQIVATIDSLIAAVRYAADQTDRAPCLSEILVVDNDPEAADRTAELVERCGVTLITEHAHKGVSYARQKGHVAARAPVVAGTDGDTRVPPTWIAAHHGHYHDPQVLGVTGRFTFDRVHWLYKGYMIARVPWRALKAGAAAVTGIRHPPGFTGANLSYRKAAADTFGGFELGSDKGEDSILGENLATLGKTVLDTSPEITVQTSGRRYNTFGRAAGEIRRNVASVVRRMLWLPSPRGKGFRDIRD